MVDILTYLGYAAIITLAIILVVYIVDTLHRHGVEDRELQMERMGIEHDDAIQDKYFNFMQQRAISSDQKAEQDSQFQHRILESMQLFDQSFMTKISNLFTMQSMNDMINTNKMTQAMVNALNMVSAFIAYQLIQAGLDQQQALSLINNASTVDELEAVLNYASKLGANPQSMSDAKQLLDLIRSSGVQVQTIPSQQNSLQNSSQKQ